jgi:hypothetical protein
MGKKRLFILVICSMAILLPTAALAAVQDGGGGADEEKPGSMYPVNIRPAGEAALKVEADKTADAEDVMTVMGRFYLWQKQKKEGDLLEFQADNAVVWYADSREFEGYLYVGGCCDDFRAADDSG